MKKYVNILDLALPYLYGSWDLEKFFLWLQPVGEVSLYCLLDIGPICIIKEIDFECKCSMALETRTFESKLIARKFSPLGLLFVLSCNIYDKDERSARDRKDMKHDLFCLASLDNWSLPTVWTSSLPEASSFISKISSFNLRSLWTIDPSGLLHL